MSHLTHTVYFHLSDQSTSDDQKQADLVGCTPVPGEGWQATWQSAQGAILLEGCGGIIVLTNNITVTPFGLVYKCWGKDVAFCL